MLLSIMLGVSPLSRLVLCLWTVLACSHPLAHPAGGNINDVVLSDSIRMKSNPTQISKRAPNFYARILPLGASIMKGWTSTYGNGARKPLRDALRQAGWDVNMVGTLSNGSMADNQHSAVVGYRVDQVYTNLTIYSDKYQPNIVLLNAGTNDCIQLYELDSIDTRINTLLDYLYSKIPGVTIIMMTVVPSSEVSPEGITIASVRDEVNNKYRAILADRIRNGYRFILSDADMFMSPTDIGSDGIHPTEYGYTKLASLWYAAIDEAWEQGMLEAPNDSDFVTDTATTADSTNNQCAKVYGNGVGPVNDMAGTSGADDGTYIHTSTNMGIALTITTSTADITFWTVKLYDRDFDDIVYFVNPGIYQSLANDKAGKWPVDTLIYVEDECIARGVRWADMNGDGLDDFVCIDADGNIFVSINNGLASGSQTFTLLGGTYKTSEGAQDRVRLLDIDGDGRFDYCIIADNGDISCWRNGGVGDNADPWQALGIVFTGKNEGDVNGVMFADLNGDGRSDWIWLDDTGAGSAYTNSRSCSKGALGGGLTPNWREANEPTFLGMGTAGARDNIHFGRVYGETNTFGMLPPHDYIWIEMTDTSTYNQISHESTSSYTYDFHVYKNTGTGGTKLKGDGVRFCNMFGHTRVSKTRGIVAGQDDYAWIYEDGLIRVYESPGTTFPATAPYWGENRVIFDTERGGRQLDRRDLHLVDWNGDGACDIVYVEPTTNVLELWTNNILTSGDFNWGYSYNPAPNLSCAQTRGLGLTDLAVRFADLDGNGYVDFLCIAKDGTTTAFLQTSPNVWEDVGQVKKSEGKDRANLRWADIDDDGRDDFLWMDKFDGDTYAWHNAGQITTGDSSFDWVAQGPVFQGQGQGECQSFPDLNGDGRADLEFTQATNDTGFVFYNECPGIGLGGDDSDTFTDAALPTFTLVDPAEVIPSYSYYVALGDSFATGYGAGTQLYGATNPYDLDGGCGTYSGSYPVYTDARDNSKALAFLACSGANITTITTAGSKRRADSQIKLMSGISDDQKQWATVTIGYNDGKIGTALNACLYRFRNTTTTCGDAIANTNGIINGDQFVLDLASAYQQILDNGGTGFPPFRLIVLGYARFFSLVQGEADLCSNQLLPNQPIYKNIDTNPLTPLTLEIRTQFNNIINDLNAAIVRAVTMVTLNSQYIVYKDVNDIFEGHRFCEPTGSAWDDGSWFFESEGDDTLPDGTTVPDASVPQEPVEKRDVSQISSSGDNCEWVPEEDEVVDNRVMACTEGIVARNSHGLTPRALPPIPTWRGKLLHYKSIGSDAVAAELDNVVSQWNYYIQTAPK